MIPFNKPFLTGNEIAYIEDAIKRGQISGNGYYTHKCHEFFKERFSFKKCLLTTSGTDALEMAALLINLNQDDEVIMPSYTFVSTANAFALRGARIVFCDSQSNHPNLDVKKLEPLITPKTKAIVVVHYGGMAVDMDSVMFIANKYNVTVIEDAAQCINSFYTSPQNGKLALGSIGHIACFSFHETKNVISGEGGMLVVNEDSYAKRADLLWEKGTNRLEFFNGGLSKYEWVDVGSSFLPSEIIAAFLFAQLENLENIHSKRIAQWQFYKENLKIKPSNSSWNSAEKHCGWNSVEEQPNCIHNGHLYFLTAPNREKRDKMISHLRNHGVYAVFHYQSLHISPYYLKTEPRQTLKNSEKYSDTLIRLPLFYELTEEEMNKIVSLVNDAIISI